MKLFFSFFVLTYLAHSHATMIEVSFISGQQKKAEMVLEILKKKFYLPQNLLMMSESQFPCQAHKKRIVHLCVTKLGELELLWMDKKRFDYTLSHMIQFPPLELAEAKNEK